MSIKLYKGFKIQTDSFQEVLKIVEGFRPIITIESQKIMDSFMNNVKETYQGDKESIDCQIACFSLWNNLRQKILQEKQQRMETIDTDFSITLYPQEGYVLGTVFTEHNAWYQKWYAQDKVEEYAYWNNMDKPNNITQKQWEQREKDWSFMNHTPYSMQGFTIDIVDPNGPKPSFLRK